MEHALKPCPFCGGAVTVEEQQIDAVSRIWRFVCDKCGLSAYFDYMENEAEAAAAWNSRRPWAAGDRGHLARNLDKHCWNCGGRDHAHNLPTEVCLTCKGYGDDGKRIDPSNWKPCGELRTLIDLDKLLDTLKRFRRESAAVILKLKPMDVFEMVLTRADMERVGHSEDIRAVEAGDGAECD